MDEFPLKKRSVRKSSSYPRQASMAKLCKRGSGAGGRFGGGQSSCSASFSTFRASDRIVPMPTSSSSFKSPVGVTKSQSVFTSPPDWLLDTAQDGNLKRLRKEAQEADFDKKLSESRVHKLNELYKKLPKHFRKQLAQLKYSTTKDSDVPKMEELVKHLKWAPNINLPFGSSAQDSEDSSDGMETFFHDYVPPQLDDVLSMEEVLFCSSLPIISFTPDPATIEDYIEQKAEDFVGVQKCLPLASILAKPDLSFAQDPDDDSQSMDMQMLFLSLAKEENESKSYKPVDLIEPHCEAQFSSDSDDFVQPEQTFSNSMHPNGETKSPKPESVSSRKANSDQSNMSPIDPTMTEFEFKTKLQLMYDEFKYLTYKLFAGQELAEVQNASQETSSTGSESPSKPTVSLLSIPEKFRLKYLHEQLKAFAEKIKCVQQSSEKTQDAPVGPTSAQSNSGRARKSRSNRSSLTGCNRTIELSSEDEQKVDKKQKMSHPLEVSDAETWTISDDDEALMK